MTSPTKRGEEFENPVATFEQELKVPPQSPEEESSDSDEEVDNDYPELLFVPLQATLATVPARAFVAYIVSLVAFCYILLSQHVDMDFRVNQGLRQGASLFSFEKMSTIDDYQSWWPQLISGLETWQEATDGAAAVLVGQPTVLQVRKTPSWPRTWANFSLS
jgi:hypothetical protein